MIDVYEKRKDRNKLPSVKDLNEPEEQEVLYRMLKSYIVNNDKKLSAKQLIEKYKNELVNLYKYDNDTEDMFGFVNVWWVFGEVAKELNYKILMTEVENVGYKRTKRGEKPRPNEFYRQDSKGVILLNDGIKETALDILRYDVDCSFNDLFEFPIGKKIDINSLDDFLYAEIRNVSKDGEVESMKLNFDDRNFEEEDYYKKIEKGDIIQTNENSISISKVRSNLKKYVFIDDENKNYFILLLLYISNQKQWIGCCIMP
ncbi:MAG: hypothetical protein LBS81_01175 [Endomicrobium sp.]|nr:hypothetical protein [Endomicrobium sp.]